MEWLTGVDERKSRNCERVATLVLCKSTLVFWVDRKSEFARHDQAEMKGMRYEGKDGSRTNKAEVRQGPFK